MKILKAISILLGLGFLFFIGYVLMIAFAFGAFDKNYSVTDLKENFIEKRREIYELKKYFNEIVPKNRFVEIEFDNDNTLTRYGRIVYYQVNSYITYHYKSNSFVSKSLTVHLR